MQNRVRSCRTRLALMASVGVVASCLSACNTVQGVGTDIKETGENTQKMLQGGKSSSSTSSNNDTMASKR